MILAISEEIHLKIGWKSHETQSNGSKIKSDVGAYLSIYTHTHTHTHIYIYIYIYTHTMEIEFLDILV